MVLDFALPSAFCLLLIYFLFILEVQFYFFFLSPLLLPLSITHYPLFSFSLPLFGILLMSFFHSISLSYKVTGRFFPKWSSLMHSAQPAIISVSSGTACWVPMYNLCKKYHFVVFLYRLACRKG